jgi:hypothetical protein
MLKKVYGEMIIKEGSILYHTSDELFQYNNDEITLLIFTLSIKEGISFMRFW